MSLLTDTVVMAHDRWDGPSAWWPVFPALWLLAIAGVITAVILVSRRNRRTAGARAGEARLAELFAAGEISEDEYRHRLAVLKEQQT
jgi:putative membrane protein